LERNDSSGFNPDAAKERLEAEGMTVKRFDVRGSAQTVLFRAGSFFGDEKQAERVIRERSVRLAAFEKTKANIREGQVAVIPSAIRSSIRHEHYVFIVSKRCSLSKLLNDSSGLMNNTSMSGSEKMPGGNGQAHCSGSLPLPSLRSPRRELLESCADMLLRRSANCIMASMHDQD